MLMQPHALTRLLCVQGVPVQLVRNTSGVGVAAGRTAHCDGMDERVGFALFVLPIDDAPMGRHEVVCASRCLIDGQR